MTQFADAGWSPDMHASMWMARETVRRVLQEYLGEDLVITSAMRPQSPGGSSLHPLGRAMDIRTRHLAHDVQRELARRIQVALGPDFDVVVEGPAALFDRYRGRPPHIHVEYDPKGRHAQRLVEVDR